MLTQTTFKTLAVQSIPFDRHRTYLMILPTDETGVTISISGDPAFTVTERWEPQVAPMNDMVITGNGFIIFAGGTYS